MVHVGLLSGVVFTLFYGILLWTIHLLSPDFIDCWTPAAQLPFTTLGLPTFEFVWAFCFGFTWPMLMVYVQDASIDESDVSTVGDASR